MSNATRIALCLSALLALAVQGQAAAITFGSASDLSNNFVQTVGDTTTPSWKWNSSGYVTVTRGPDANYPAGSIGIGHDAVKYFPGSTNVLLDNVTVRLDFRTSHDDGMSVYLGGGASLTGKIFMQTRVNASGTNDRVVLLAGRSMENASNVGGTNQGAHDFDTTVAPGSWYHLVFEVDRTSSTALTATMSVYDGATLKYSDTRTSLTDTNTAGSWIGINAYGVLAGQTVDLDNIEITNDTPPPAVPEPETLALVGTGALGIVGYAIRRRMKR